MYISPCGNYVASIGSDNEVQIFTVYREIIRTFDISSLVKKHLQSFDFATGGVKKLKIIQMSWEKILANKESGKIAVAIESLTEIKQDQFALLMVLELKSAPNQEPIIIQQRASEGIESFDWIEPLDGAVDEQESAYENSKQLIIYTKFNVLGRLYSLSCSNVLFEIPKPSKIIQRPGTNGGGFMVISNDIDSMAINFINQGNTSAILNKFSMSANGEVSWSNSGKWLLNFIQDIFGFQVEVYNSLGFSINSQQLGVPFLKIDDQLANNLISYNYEAFWITLKNNDTVLILHISSSNLIYIRLVLVNHLKSLPLFKLNDHNDTVWMPSENGYQKQTAEYTKGFFKFAKVLQEFLILVFDQTVFIYQIGENFHLLDVIYINCKQVILSDTNILIVNDQEILAYKNGHLITIYTSSSNRSIHAVSPAGKSIICFDQTGGWTQLQITNFENNNLKQDSHENILDWGKRYKRDRLSLGNESKDDITDTFMQKARRIK